ncbi:MAG TPA: phosphatase [Ruminococcaceae bacterium]|nr:phosphatase [Oscillospiraceae bacterium]
MNKKNDLKVAAVIDIGSSTLKMRISQLKKNKISDIDRLEHPVCLGHEVFTEGKISFESLRELSSLLHGFSGVMDEYGVKQYRVVATTALRDAKNRSYVVDQLRIQNGMNVEVLEDDQEKTLIYYEIIEFFKKAGKLNGESALIAYIGAGTIGFAVYDGTQMVFSQNIPMGSLKLPDMLGNIQNLSDDFYTVAEEYLDTILEHIKIPINGGRVENLILTGTETKLMAKICGIKPSGGCCVINALKLRELFEKIRSMTREKISLAYGISEEDAELLYSSLAISLRLLKFTTSDTVVSPDVELWDALMRLMLMPKSGGDYSAHVRSNAISCAQEIAKAYDCDAVHSETIRMFACRIFDKMKGAHGLDRRKRLLLELAAILHECGHYVTVKQHLASSFDLIKDIDIYGMTDKEMLMTAYTARYNEYEVPAFDDFKSYVPDEGDRITTAKLVAIFRLANALDKSRKQKLKDIKVRLKNDKLIISSQSGENFYLEMWAFRQCAPFFKEVFGYEPELSVKSSLI